MEARSTLATERLCIQTCIIGDPRRRGDRTTTANGCSSNDETLQEDKHTVEFLEKSVSVWEESFLVSFLESLI